jgi:3-oxoadipate enol-lactonase
MPYATTSDKVRLYFEEAGSGVPILFLHEFAADHRGWEPQLDAFARSHRCIVYASRGYKPSDVPADKNAYGYLHMMRDAVAVLDHLKIEAAHLVGLSMGGYTAVQVALNHPKRVRSLLLAGAGAGSERWYTDEFHKNSRAVGDQFEREGSEAMAKSYGMGPSRLQFMEKDPRGFAEFIARLADRDAKGSAMTSRGFQGARPSLYDFAPDIRKIAAPALIVVGDEDERCVEPSRFLKDAIPASGLAVLPKTGHVVNLEEPELFNALMRDFLVRAEAGRWGPRNPNTRAPKPGPAPWD